MILFNSTFPRYKNIIGEKNFAFTKANNQNITHLNCVSMEMGIKKVKNSISREKKHKKKQQNKALNTY